MVVQTNLLAPVAALLLLGGIILASASGCAGDTFPDGGGGTASGGNSANTGGGDGSGGETSTGSCQSDDDCMAAANWSDPCFSVSCSSPIVARTTEVQRNPCLVAWEERDENVPEQCTSSEDVACPLMCAQQPLCVAAVCDEETCKLETGNSAAECDASGKTP